MSWLANALKNARNVFKRTQSTESPISTEPTIPVEPVDGSTTSDSTPGGPTLNPDTGNRALRRKWRSLAKRFPDSDINKADRWGMLSQFYTDGYTCRCLACRQGFTTWEEGRTHECKEERSFRKITQRRIPRPNRKEKAGPRSPATGDTGDRPGIEPDRVGVVADSSKPDPGRSRGDKRRQRDSSRASSSSKSSPQGALRDQGSDTGIGSDREADTKP